MSRLLSTSRTGPVTGDPPPLPAQAVRRLSAIQHRAATLALAALYRAGVERPDAIIASTALGCLDDTERFLADMRDAKGALLSPLPFMRSTHNTMAGQLALMLGCHGPNITHSQGLNGFHAALAEAELMLHDHPKMKVLVLAIDERTDLLARVAATLDATTTVGHGGEAFVLAGDTEDVPCIARMGWQNGATARLLLPLAERPVHGAVVAEGLGSLLGEGLRAPVVLSGGYPSTALLISPC